MAHKAFALLTILIFVGLASTFIGAQQGTPVVGESPFTIDADRIVIQVRFAGNGPYRMVLRTGASNSYVDASFLSIVKKSGGALIPLSAIPEGVREVKARVGAQLKDLEIGSYRMNRTMAVLEDFNKMNLGEQRLSAPIHGMLGFNLLKGQVVQIDYLQRVLRFLASSPYKKDDVRRGDASRFTIPLRMSPVDYVPVVDEVYIGNKKIKAVLDTGYAGTLALLPRGVKSLGLSTGTLPIILTKIGMAAEISLTPELVPDYAYESERFEAYDAVIGHAFLSNYVLTLDGKGKLVTLEKR